MRIGEITAAQNEQECPHIVEIAVPPNGLGSALLSIYTFHRERGLDLRRGRTQQRESQDFVRWCFKRRNDAEDFSKLFSGKFVS
jgi:hypothetical protein